MNLVKLNGTFLFFIVWSIVIELFFFLPLSPYKGSWVWSASAWTVLYFFAQASESEWVEASEGEDEDDDEDDSEDEGNGGSSSDETGDDDDDDEEDAEVPLLAFLFQLKYM